MKIVDLASVGLCAAWLLALLWVCVPDHDLLSALWSQTTAAWVQAIGSVAAILAAVWIDRGTSRRAALVALDREERLQTGVLLAAHEAALWIGAASEAGNNALVSPLARRAAHRRAFTIHLDHATHVLSAFSAEALAETGLLPHVIRMRQNLWVASAAIGGGTFNDITLGRAELRECFQTAAQVLAAMESDLNVPHRDLDREVEDIFVSEARPGD